MLNTIFMTFIETAPMSNFELATIILSSISLLFVLIGGVFALLQWQQGLKYKRSDIVKPLIDNVRSNENISMVMNMIDWDKCFNYDGEFHKELIPNDNPLKKYSDEQLFNIIDETLSIFSYICYLKKVGSLKKEDMRLFNYEIRRLFDNEHICNYLYSLYHWSLSLNVEMSFSHLIEYALTNKYLNQSFLEFNCREYKCYLLF